MTELADAIEAARLAGQIIAKNVNSRIGVTNDNDAMVHKEKSNNVDLQTATDVECERVCPLVIT